MRPYLSILRDAFREATASRTLPFLLVFFTIVLAVLAPLGLRENVPWQLRPADLADVRLLTMKLAAGADADRDSPAKRAFERLPENLRGRMARPERSAGSASPPPENPFAPSELQRELAEGLNDHVLSDRTFYEPAAWKRLSLNDEAKALLERGVAKLPEDEVHRLNRLLFDAAFSAAVIPVGKSSAELTWLGAEIPVITDALRQMSVDKAEVQRQTQDLLRIVSSWIVGPLGLLVAIFVTSTVIPRMFEAGAIDLLLSKPVSRTGLYLARFFSGCVFVLITFTYFIAGLWLIVGTRLGVWNNGLLLAIPLLLFTFAVIYSVSAATGVVWQNPIVSVFAAVLVWGAGFLVGVVEDTVATFRNGDRTREIVPAGDSLIVSDKNGRIFEWSNSSRSWNEIYEGPKRPVMAGLIYPLLGPVHDSQKDRLIIADVGPGGTNRLLVAQRSNGHSWIDGASLPPVARSLFMTDRGGLFAAGQAGIFRFKGEPTTKTAQFDFLGFSFGGNDTENGFSRIDADRESGWSRDVAAAVDRRSETIAVADRGKLLRFDPTEAGYTQAAEVDLEIEEPALLGMGGDRLIAAFANGTVQLFDAGSLKPLATFQLPDGDPPRTALVSPDGRRAAVLTHGGHLAVYDAGKGELLKLRLRGQGDISAATFAADGSLWASDRLMRLTRYESESLEREESFEGPLTKSELFYRYALQPLRWLLPNTYGLRNAETYLFTDRKSEAFGGPDARLEAERLSLDVWGPIWQNAAFLAVVLGLTCVYIARKDF